MTRSDKLGTISITSTNSSAPIKYYGGTKAQIDALNIFPAVPTKTLGGTACGRTYSGTHTYGGSTKDWYTITSATGFVISKALPGMTFDNYVKTTSHEVGHALGWFGHPSSSQPTWIMEQGLLENTTLGTGEKNHLSQIY